MTNSSKDFVFFGYIRDSERAWLTCLLQKYLEETDFVQLIVRLSNDTSNPLWYIYTVNGQCLISLAYFHLNSFLAIIILRHEESLDER